MSNTWFQFKKFKINQGNCAMKVTTDACIQGAWTPIPHAINNVLDIGTGTGLLSLMLAQRNPDIKIDAIELDAAAAIQATQNFTDSPWTNRIQCTHADIRTHETDKSYDLIICNPPFFTQSLLGPTSNKNMARHDISLTGHQLLRKASALLSHHGSLSLLLPHNEYLQWRNTMNTCNLYESQCLLIKHTPTASVKRVVTILSHTPTASPSITELSIQDNNGHYTALFRELLTAFYLNL